MYRVICKAGDFERSDKDRATAIGLAVATWELLPVSKERKVVLFTVCRNNTPELKQRAYYRTQDGDWLPVPEDKWVPAAAWPEQDADRPNVGMLVRVRQPAPVFAVYVVLPTRDACVRVHKATMDFHMTEARIWTPIWPLREMPPALEDHTWRACASDVLLPGVFAATADDEMALIGTNENDGNLTGYVRFHAELPDHDERIETVEIPFDVLLKRLS